MWCSFRVLESARASGARKKNNERERERRSEKSGSARGERRSEKSQKITFKKTYFSNFSINQDSLLSPDFLVVAMELFLFSEG